MTVEITRIKGIAKILSEYLSINKAVHEPARFAILEILAINGLTDYNSLKNPLRLTDGNLYGHLSRLEREGYIEVKKTFFKRKPKTMYKITDKGLKSLREYLSTTVNTLRSMEKHLNELKTRAR